MVRLQNHCFYRSHVLSWSIVGWDDIILGVSAIKKRGRLMAWLKMLMLSYSLEAGGMPVDAIQVNEYQYLRYQNQVYTALDLRVSINDYFSIGGNSEIKAEPGWQSFSPTIGEFTFYATGHITNRIEVGFQHTCAHFFDDAPLPTGVNRTGIDRYRTGYEKLYIKFSGASKLF